MPAQAAFSRVPVELTAEDEGCSAYFQRMHLTILIELVKCHSADSEEKHDIQRQPSLAAE